MQRFFRSLGKFVEKRRVLVIAVGLALIIPSVFGAMQLDMSTGRGTLIPTDSQVYKDIDRFNQHFSSNVIVVMVTGDDIAQLLQPENVRAMEVVENETGANPNVISAVGPAFLIKQMVPGDTGTPRLPEEPQALLNVVVDPQTGEIRPEFKSVFPDDKHALIPVVLKGGLSSDEQKGTIREIERAAASAGFIGVEFVVTGESIFGSKVEDLITSGMSSMIILAIILMLVILALIFSVRGFFAWRWLPLGVVLIAIIYAFGAMGALGIPMTMVTMSAFPVLIGLGVDYAIQFHNRYDEEARRGETVADAIIDSVTHIGPAIGIAIVTACLGFAALFFSPVPMIQDFGYTLIAGVVACYILAMFFLLAILYHRDRRAKPIAPASKEKRKQAKGHMGFVERGLHRLAPWVIKNPVIILPLALVLCLGGVIADDHIGTETDEKQLISQDLQVMQDLNTLEAVSGGLSSANLLVEAEDITDPEILTWMVELEQRIKEEQSAIVKGTNSVAALLMKVTGGQIPQDPQQAKDALDMVPVPIKRNLVTDDYTAANVVVTVGELGGEQRKEITAYLTDYTADPPLGVNVAVTGAPVWRDKVIGGFTSGRVEMTVIGIGFVFLGLLLLFGFRIIRVLMAILPIVLIIGWSSGVMYLAGIEYTPSTATMGALIMGIGVEFTVLLMMRYYEERNKGEEPIEAMSIAMTKIGRAIIASGLTVIGGFGALLIARDFPVLVDFGIMTMMNVFFALVSTLVVLPPLIVRVDSWREKRRLARSA